MEYETIVLVELTEDCKTVSKPLLEGSPPSAVLRILTLGGGAHTAFHVIFELPPCVGIKETLNWGLIALVCTHACEPVDAVASMFNGPAGVGPVARPATISDELAFFLTAVVEVYVIVIVVPAGAPITVSWSDIVEPLVLISMGNVGEKDPVIPDVQVST